MKIAPLADVKARFSSYLKESEEGPIIVTRNGKPVAMLLSIGDEEEIDRMVLAYSPKFQRILRAAKQQIRDGRGIKHQEFWREMEAKAK
jgi:prevent-host-death family protein